MHSSNNSGNFSQIILWTSFILWFWSEPLKKISACGHTFTVALDKHGSRYSKEYLVAKATGADFFVDLDWNPKMKKNTELFNRNSQNFQSCASTTISSTKHFYLVEKIMSKHDFSSFCNWYSPRQVLRHTIKVPVQFNIHVVHTMQLHAYIALFLVLYCLDSMAKNHLFFNNYNFFFSSKSSVLERVAIFSTVKSVALYLLWKMALVFFLGVALCTSNYINRESC